MSFGPAYIRKIEDVSRGTDYVYYANKQLKLAGSILEFKQYQQHFAMFRSGYSTSFLLGLKKESEPVYDPEDIANRVYIRSRTRIRDYVNANAGYHFSTSGRPFKPVFVTLTYRDNLSDLSVTNRQFTDFIRRVNYSYFNSSNGLKYLAVPEFQKRGAVHYHSVFFNLPYRGNVRNFFSEVWPYGYSHIRGINRVANLGIYISKYLKKDRDEQLADFRKSYFVARGMLQPLVTNFDEIIGEAVQDLPQESLEQEQHDIPLQFLGSMNYQRWNLQGFKRTEERVRQVLGQMSSSLVFSTVSSFPGHQLV